MTGWWLLIEPLLVLLAAGLFATAIYATAIAFAIARLAVRPSVSGETARSPGAGRRVTGPAPTAAPPPSTSKRQGDGATDERTA